MQSGSGQQALPESELLKAGRRLSLPPSRMRQPSPAPQGQPVALLRPLAKIAALRGGNHALRCTTSAQLSSAVEPSTFRMYRSAAAGGGALGSYQAGVYEALADDWVPESRSGPSNSALIAGNAPGERVEAACFWQEVTANPLLDWSVALESLSLRGDYACGLFNQLSAVSALTRGTPISSSSVSRSHGCTRRGA